MPPLRLILDNPADGAWNMAVDEVLLRTAAEEGVATLRFYGWNEPTLSLGYFQSHHERERHPASRGCALVRRASGGGAILHHHELTYCFAAPLGPGWSREPGKLYRLFHETLIAALGQWSPVDSPLRWCDAVPQAETPTASPQSAADEPFLCFQRRTAEDVVLKNAKIAGSAQRRRGRAIAQHGSVLLHVSPYAPELPGWNDLSSTSITAAELRDCWLTLLEPAITTITGGADASSASEPDRTVAFKLSDAELAAAEELRQSKYRHPHWTDRK